MKGISSFHPDAYFMYQTSTGNQTSGIDTKTTTSAPIGPVKPTFPAYRYALLTSILYLYMLIFLLLANI